MRVLSIKVAIRKESGNLFNDPRIMNLIYVSPPFVVKNKTVDISLCLLTFTCLL